MARERKERSSVAGEQNWGVGCSVFGASVVALADGRKGEKKKSQAKKRENPADTSPAYTDIHQTPATVDILIFDIFSIFSSHAHAVLCCTLCSPQNPSSPVFMRLPLPL